MDKRIIITSEELKEQAVFIIRKLPTNEAFVVDIKKRSKIRSIEQNALYWKWIEIISSELGYKKEDFHYIMKKEFLLNIYLRNNHQGIVDCVESVKKIRDIAQRTQDINLNDQADTLARRIIEMLSTTDATTKEFSEYLDCIERKANSLGIRLPAPEYYNESAA